MPVDFCVEDGCDRFAVHAGYWQGRGRNLNPARPRPRRCREHYLQVCGGEFVRAEVTGDARIVDVRTGESVAAGGVVELDPVATNIRVLVASGLIRQPKPAEKPRPAAEKK